MKCPNCGSLNDKVIDSRSLRDEAAIRRRRECLACGMRWTTYEELYREETVVVKRDGSREPFDRAKLERAINRACGKRKISFEVVGNIIDNVLAALPFGDITSDMIATEVMNQLHKVDEVAYIRFASVYRSFTDVEQFLSVITEIGKNGQRVP